MTFFNVAVRLHTGAYTSYFYVRNFHGSLSTITVTSSTHKTVSSDSPIYPKMGDLMGLEPTNSDLGNQAPILSGNRSKTGGPQGSPTLLSELEAPRLMR